jgi:uncharacterized repeat protein (TIGR03803 family)
MFFAAAFLAGSALAAHAAPYTQKVLYKFCSHPFCTDGLNPTSGTIADAQGNFYGTTTQGGAQQQSDQISTKGMVYELQKNGTGWTLKVLHSFCTHAGCTEGSTPRTGVIMDVNGNLYGLTSEDGIDNAGTAYELIPNAARTKWKMKVLHRFCTKPTFPNCADGYKPNGLTYAGAESGAPYDGTSPLYGATQVNVYSLTPIPGKTKWAEKVLYTFCQTQCSANDPRNPNPVTADTAGNLFGTAQGSASGVAFELSPNTKGKYKLLILSALCAPGTCAGFGGAPTGGIVRDAAQNIYGTVASPGGQHGGVVYKLTKSGDGYSFADLHNFCPDQNDCEDGDFPQGGLVLDPAGHIFGTTFIGGNDTDNGVAFALDPSFEDIYIFCVVGACTDGTNPNPGMLIDGQGNLYGTTEYSGPTDGGVIFELSP